MSQKSRNVLARIPRMLFALDLVGSIWIGLGLWVLMTDDKLPIFGDYNRLDVGVGFLLVGFLLMVPFVVVLVRTVVGAQKSGPPTA